MTYYSNFICVLISILIAQLAPAQVRVTHLLCDNRTAPIGLGNPQPRLSWQLEGEGRNITQNAYELRVGRDSSATAKGRNLNWTSGKVESAQSVHVRYGGGGALASGETYYWQVRVWDEKGKVSPWSGISHWQMGLLQPEDWKAQWIGPGHEEDTINRPSPLLRHAFTTHGQPVKATLYITAHGLYEAWLNGERVSDARLAPGWTEYDHRLQYQAYDVTRLLRKGANTAGVLLGDGWFRGVFGPWMYSNNYGTDASLLFQLVLTYPDGTKDTVVSNGSWKCATGGIRYADLYGGEVFDARMEPRGWTQNDFDDKTWGVVSIRIFPTMNLVASETEPVKEEETFAPVKIFTSPRGELILDFGQNLAGWVRCRLHGQAGDTVKLSHAEVLDKNGNFYTGNLREAKAQDVYILSGKGVETFEPHFTFHGYRYVKLEGYKEEVRPEDFRSVSLYTALPVTGHFHCSDSLINRLQENIVWSQQSNFVDIPTDCPQRSERLGWAGDAQMFAATAAFNKRVDNFFDKWLADVRAAQGKDGGMPVVIPDITNRTLHRAPRGVAGWGDAAVIMPWTLFEVYGDTDRLAVSYSSMRAWVHYIHEHAPGGLWKGGGYGDWLAPDPVVKPGEDTVRATPTDLPYISQCFYYYSTSLLARTAGILGKPQDSLNDTRLMDTIRAAFLQEYMTPDARAISNTQTAFVLALFSDILPEKMAERAAQRLVQLIRDNQDHLGTGFLGTPQLCTMLTKYGYTDVAYTLIRQTTAPSWLYPIKMGATTIWEKWLGLFPDRSINVCSFNHYAYGAVGNWLYRAVAGIAPGAPGYKRIIIHPYINDRLQDAEASYVSDYGLISSGWRSEPDGLSLDVTIPANTRGEVWIPAADASRVSEQGKPLADLAGAVMLPARPGFVVVEVGSGQYRFRVGR